MQRLLVLLAAATGLAMAPGTDALAGNAATRHYLDRHTGASITTMERPLVFARERSALAVNARDYVSLVAVDINRNGQHQLYWYGYLWTTVDDRGQPASGTASTGWLLLADARPIALHPVTVAPRELGIGQPPLPAPVRNATVVMFAADAESLDYLGAATSLSLRGAGVDYELWRDTREDLARLLGQLSD